LRLFYNRLNSQHKRNEATKENKERGEGEALLSTYYSSVQKWREKWKPREAIEKRIEDLMDDAMMERDDLITVPTLTYKPPNANDYPQPPSWQHALSAILTHVETDASSPIVLFMNENYVCIYDKYPKAKHHCLLMPRLGMLKVSSINELTPHHLDELKRFHALARNIVHELQTSISNAGDHPIPEFKLGYHAIPSLTPLHLHIISTDFDSSCMKTKHHINSFTSKFFVTAEALEAHLESAFVSFNCNKALFADVRKNMAENLLDDGMKCTKCNRTALNLPDWKRHNQSCQVDTKKTKFDCAVNVLLGWSSREFYGPNPNFAHQLSKTAFTIFNPLQDLGYYTINPKQDTYNSLSNIKSAQEILCYIDTNGTPDRLQSITGKEEVAFENPIQTALENRFPYGQMEVAGLHVAALVSALVTTEYFKRQQSVNSLLS
jgi:aprataxin